MLFLTRFKNKDLLFYVVITNLLSKIHYQYKDHEGFLGPLISGNCERYELKIDYVAMDQVCTWSHYKVDILLYD